MADGNVTTRCVSLGTGALSPDLRVNYEFGLVLGVSEFRQEQSYILEKDYLYNRAAHGFGTYYGLSVTVDPVIGPEGTPADTLITVRPGVALDQWGRPIVIRDPQCARLGAWLAREVREGRTVLTDPPTPMQVYVVARYAEMLDALVPIAGQPCSSSDTTQAPSRIRDCFNIELRRDPPRMPAWDIVQRFARLMSFVRLVPGLSPDDSAEPTLIEEVRDLDGEGFPHPPAPGSFYRLPSETAQEALDRIFTVWVTEVRPHASAPPDLTDPDGPNNDASEDTAGILLARIEFVPNGSFNLNEPKLSLVGEPDDTGRPFLLHTQLIQELMTLGNGMGDASKDHREFATIHVIDNHRLMAWVHHPESIRWPEDRVPFELLSDGAQLSIAAATRVQDNVFEIRSTEPITPGARIELRFNLDVLDVLMVESTSLRTIIDALDYAYLGRNEGFISVYTVADELPLPREFVTINTVAAQADQPARLNLWFHVDSPVFLPATLTLRRDLSGQDRRATTHALHGGTPAKQWELTSIEGGELHDDELIEIFFDTDQIWIQTTPVTPEHRVKLTDLIKAEHLAFTGYDGDHTIRAFHTVDNPPGGGPSVEEIIQGVLSIPTQPFVTITNLSQQQTPNEPPVFELWFHLNLGPEDNSVHLIEPMVSKDQVGVQLFAEIDRLDTNLEIGVTLTPTNYGGAREGPLRNVYTAVLDTGRWPAVWSAIAETGSQSILLRFSFPLSLQLSVSDDANSFTLRQHILNNRIKFDGSIAVKKDDQFIQMIVAYVRIPIGR